jgi:hypothetical protein
VDRAIELVKGDRLAFPLYHGTSSLFVDSILKNGLGGRNPIQELGVVPFLKSLHEICQHLLHNDPEWLSKKSVIEKMMNQEPKFRHGCGFLSFSKLTAVRYAASNPFGSEIISNAARLYELVIKREPRYLSELQLTKYPIIALVNKSPYPVLVEVSRVHISNLQGEQGESAQQVIGTLAQLLSKLPTEPFEVLIEVLGQQSNFQLVKPVDARWLQMYKIRVTKYDPIFPKYDLMPLTRKQ